MWWACIGAKTVSRFYCGCRSLLVLRQVPWWARDQHVLTCSHAESSVAALQHVLNAHVLHTYTLQTRYSQWCTLGVLVHSLQVAASGGKAHAAYEWGVLMVAMDLAAKSYCNQLLFIDMHGSSSCCRCI